MIQMTHNIMVESLGEESSPILVAESAPHPPAQTGSLLGSTSEEVGQPRVPKCGGHLLLACQMNWMQMIWARIKAKKRKRVQLFLKTC